MQIIVRRADTMVEERINNNRIMSTIVEFSNPIPSINLDIRISDAGLEIMLKTTLICAYCFH